jgi:quinol monooxygenase YgiN
MKRVLHVQVDSPPHVFEDEVGLKLPAPEEGRAAGDEHLRVHAQGSVVLTAGHDRAENLTEGVEAFPQDRAAILNKDCSMANSDLVFYVKLQVKPDCVEEWQRAFAEIVELMSQEEAFVSCYLHQDTQDPNLFTLYERWNERSVEDFLKHQMKPYRLAYDAKLPALLERPREPAVLVPIREWHKAP